MLICGLQKLSMVDYPGKLAATVFTGGCDLRCPFCHNAPLVTEVASAPVFPVEEVLEFLSSRTKFLDGVVLTGGEPLLQPDHLDFLTQVRALGFPIKLDTNGCHPEKLARVLEGGLVDYVAMDLKNAPEKYAQTVGLPNFDLAPVEESVRLLQNSGVDYEFRTTVVQELHQPEDILAIGRWVKTAPRYFLQAYVDSGHTISPGLHPHTTEELQQLLLAARTWAPNAALRGVD